MSADEPHSGRVPSLVSGTLRSLELFTDTVEASQSTTSMIERCIRLADVPICKLSIDDLRLLVGQRIASDLLVPIALDILRDNPLTDATYFEGDLLLAALGQTTEYWRSNPKAKDRLWAILDNIKPDELASIPGCEPKLKMFLNL